MPDKNLLYINGRQWTLAFVSLVSLAAAAGVDYVVWLEPASLDEEFDSPLHAWAFKGMVMVLGHAMLVAVWWLSGRYVLEMQEAAKDTLVVKTWHWLGLHRTRRYPVSLLEDAGYVEGRTRLPGRPVVHAPWLKLRTPGGKALVLDLQGKYIDPRLLR
ncbi:MAG: hypothetical protein MUF29_06280 [Chitinophagaceae bacterium]|jgi:hypothetical protein|nr:hypothetical protein [Chitinophagaceae bacterium]